MGRGDQGADDARRRGDVRVPAELGGARLEEVLLRLLPDASRSEVARLVKRGAVRVDGQRIFRTNHVVAAGCLVRVGKPRERPRREAAPQGAELEVLFEDEHLAIVNKPAGLLMHAKEEPRVEAPLDAGRRRGAGGLAARRGGAGGRAGASGPGGWGTGRSDEGRRSAQGGRARREPGRAGPAELTLADLAVQRFGRLPLLMGDHRPGIVHRLDRETSGLVVVARSGVAMEALREAFRARTIEKAYLALVHGDPEWETRTLDWDLMDGAADRRGWRDPGMGDQSARTDVEVLERFGAAALVLCHPADGRRHQIRVHMCAAGHALVGDKLYASREEQRRLRAPRHMLHAGGLAFAHPLTGEGLEAELPPPMDMQSEIDRLVGA